MILTCAEKTLLPEVINKAMPPSNFLPVTPTPTLEVSFASNLLGFEAFLSASKTKIHTCIPSESLRELWCQVSPGEWCVARTGSPEWLSKHIVKIKLKALFLW